MSPRSEAPRPPRLLTKVLGFAFAVIACVSVVVFVLVSWQTDARLTRAVVENLETSQRRFASMEARRRREQTLQAIALAENPTLKAAIDTYYWERDDELVLDQLRSTVRTELAKLQQHLAIPALSVTDARGVILASAGPRASDWHEGSHARPRLDAGGGPVEALAVRDGRPYLATVVPLVLGPDVIGECFLAVPLDDAYADELKRESGADIAILQDGRVIGSSTPPPLRAALERVSLPLRGTVVLDGDEFVVQRLSAFDSATVYALGSVTAAARAARSETAWVLLPVGAIALLLAMSGSWWLARTVADPIDTLTSSIARMAAARDLTQPLPRDRGSRELDSLASTFDELRAAVALAEAESEEVYLGVISALATALDARDPYTAGHSQRVADVSVAIGERMELSAADLEALRLGALLHDIGKIGVSDAILRKSSKLTTEEFEQIKMHPTLGARILRPLRFLDAQLAVVELHHERLDGTGYPYGLRGDEIPLFARIVHVADAFDAMTSARAYRSAMSVPSAIAELWRHTGTDFDRQVVQAMAALPVAMAERAVTAAGGGAEEPPASPSLVRFPKRDAGPAHSRWHASILRRAE
jgi:putative nucleotidyltransferase with HDIG domain